MTTKDNETIRAYPLTWPVGQPRAKFRESARFRSSLTAAMERLRYEVDQLGGTKLVVSNNVRDALPGSKHRLADPGAAVYFTLKRKPVVIAIDRWETVGDNMQAIALTIGALRGIERWGNGQIVEQAFRGFTALPAPEQPWQVLGFDTSNPTTEQIEEAYRRLAMKHHPDRGGDPQEMARINAARDALSGRL